MTPEEMALWYAMDSTDGDTWINDNAAIAGVAGSTIFEAAVYAEKRIMSAHPSDDVRYWVGRLDALTSLLSGAGVWNAQRWLEMVRHFVRSEALADD
jgi:hypothetical protein